MAVKLFVGNLPYRTSPEALKAFFAEAGEVVSVAIITDKMTGRSRGFGFVEMADESAAQKAVEMFDGKEFEGRALKVNEARPKEQA